MIPAQRRLHWMVLLYVLAHNIEEAITMPAYWPATEQALSQFGIGIALPTTAAWYGALAAATLLPVGVVIYGATGVLSRLKVQAVAVVAAVFFLNVFVPHLIAAVMFHGYVPGLATALLLNPVITFFFFRHSLRGGWMAGSDVTRVFLIALVLLPVGLPALLLIARG